jgi:uncharacterized cupredoxin-like copper-binding protein
MRTSRLPLLAPVLAAGALLAACSGGTSTGSTYDVTAGDDSCAVSDTELDAGAATFEVKNSGKDVTEVYVYGRDGDEFTKVIGEKENIGPGTSQSFDVDLKAGTYEVACKPGMKGDGIRTRITVTGEGGGESDTSYDKELEFAVAADGTVAAPDDLTVDAGDRVEFKLENEAADEYYLTVTGPAGDRVGEGEAQGGADGEFVAELADAGDYTVAVHPDGKEAAAREFTVTVR